MPTNERYRRWLAICGTTALAVAAVAQLFAQSPPAVQATNQSSSDVRELAVNLPIERPLKGGEQHEFRVVLSVDQLLHVVVEQKGVDVVVSVINPAGTNVAEVDSPNGDTGPEDLSMIAGLAGPYRVIVQAFDPKGALGTYQIRVTEIRAATARDRAFHEARRLSLEAARGLQAGTAEALRQSIAKYEQAVPFWRESGEPSGPAGALNSVAMLANDLRDFARSRTAAAEAAALFEAAGDTNGAARALNHLGIAYAGLGDGASALQAYERALVQADRAKAPNIQASVLSNIAESYREAGQWQKALDYQLRAQPFFLAAGDGREHAISLDNLGQTYRDLDEYQNALDAMLRALALRRTAVDRRGEAITLNNLGLIYDRLGEYRTALRYYEESMAIKAALVQRDITGEAATLMNMSVAHDRLGESQKYLELSGQSLALRRSLDDPGGLANALYNIAFGRLRTKAPDYDRAMAELTEALELWARLGSRNGQANALTMIGKAHLLRANLDAAADYTARALALCRQVGNRTLEGAVLFQQAKIALARSDRPGALSLMTQVIQVLEGLRSRVSSPQLRGSYFADAQGAFEAYADVALQMHDAQPGTDLARQALEMVERGRARSLLEGLVAAGTDFRRGVDPTLLQDERTLQARIDAAASRLGSAGSGSDVQAATRKEMDSLLVDLEQLRSKLRAASPGYAALAEPAPLTAREIQTDVVDAGTVLLEFAFVGERAVVWAVTPTEIKSAPLGTRAQVTTAATQVYDLLSARNAQPTGETPDQRRARLDQAGRDLPGALEALSRMLLGPVAPLLVGKRVVVVASGALQLIPFAVLPTPGTTVPLMVDHEVVHLPSASSIAIVRRERALRREPAPSRTVAVIADPVFDATDTRVLVRGSRPAAPREQTQAVERDWERAARAAGVDTTGTGLPRLRYSRDEAESILSLVPPAERLEALDFRASRDLLVGDNLARYRIIHLATHGFLSNDRPEVSGLAFSMVNDRGEAVDGFLRLHQIYSLRLPVDLVVLSACQTALGRDLRGEGLIGLARGFMYAGASRVVSSLWKVDDQATAELMKVFYQGMLGRSRLRPVEALRAAQNTMRKQARWRDPYYWAGFTLQGEWR